MKIKVFESKAFGITVYHDDKNFQYLFETTTTATAMPEPETLEMMVSITSKMISNMPDEAKPFSVGEHVKVLGNAPNTAWESGCIESIEGDMAYILYGVKNLGEFGGLRGMAMPVPLSQLRRN